MAFALRRRPENPAPDACSLDPHAVALDHVPVGVAVLGLDGRTEYCNPCLRDLLGSTPRTYLEMFHADAREAHRNDLAVARTEDAWSTIGALDAKDGTIQAKLSFTVAAAGRLVVTIESQTEERQAQEADRVALRRLLRIKELEVVNERRGQLLNVASHELKNPLTPLVLQLHIMKEGRYGPLSDKQKSSLETMYNQVQRLNKLIHDVMDTSRIEQASLILHTDRIELGPVVRRAVDAFQGAAQQWNIQLHTDLARNVMAEADGDRIMQVVSNLLSNAFKFTPEGGTVTVTLEKAPEGAHIMVSDTGPGMDEEQQDKLFAAFSQVHAKGTKPREKGTGLGLYIAKGIVGMHEGQIWVESRKGEGTTFHVTLPSP